MISRTRTHVHDILKGSIATVLLFFCGIISVFGFNPELPGDTIIVDGRKVVINRTVEYDSTQVEEPEPEYKPPSQNRWAVGFSINGGGHFTQTESNVENRSTLDDFLGRNWRTGLSFAGDFSISHHWGKQLYVRSGFGINLKTVPNQFFPESSVHDSLEYFIAQDDELKQVLLYEYDIGAELDTVDLDLVDGNLSITRMSIPLIAGYEVPAGRGKGLNILVEIGAIGRYLTQSSGGPMMLIGDSGEFQYVSNEDLKISELQIDAHVAAGIVLDLGRTHRSVAWNPKFFSVLTIQSGLLNPTRDGSDILMRGHQVGISAGIRLFLKKKV